MHCDSHVVKMILEYAQMLCTAHHVCGNYKNPKLYKIAFKNKNLLQIIYIDDS